MTSAMQRRLTALEVQRRPGNSYVVHLPDEARGDPTATHAAIMGHRRLTGWTRPVILAPIKLTVDEWIAKYGRASP